MESSLTRPWLTDAVQLELPTGRLRYLLDVRRESCPHCSHGTRTVTVWGAQARHGEMVEWCGHCFNAVCEAMPLDPEHQDRFTRVREAASAGRISGKWRAARPALEELERRGLL